MKKFLCILLCAAMALSLLAGCGGNGQTAPTGETKHSHTYASEWSHNETSHWYQATCEHSTLQANFGDHVDEDLNGLCDICSYEDTSCQHTYSDVWSSDAESHWHAATCNHIGSVSEKAAHADENNDGTCDTCGYMGEHTHTYQETWTYDNSQHWLKATCGHEVVDQKAAHADENNDGTCDVCGWFDESHTHTFGEEWKTDVTYHWHAATCEHLGAVSEKTQHADSDEDGRCDTCQYLMCSHSDLDLDGQCDTCGWEDPEHTHEFGTEIGSDVNGHWFIATCHPGAVGETQAHDDDNNDGVCDVCAFQVCGHSFAATWTSNDTHHWHAILCTCSIDRKDYEKHVDADGDGGCDVCMYGLPVEAVYEMVLENEPFTLVEDKMITYAPVTINFPQPGKYVITPSNVEIRVWLTNDDSFFNSGSPLTLEVEQAGEMTLYFRYFDFGYKAGKEVDFTYTVIRMDDLVIDTMQGKVELPANTLYTVKFIANEVGTYKLITGVDGLVIGLSEDTMEFYKGHIELKVTEVGDEFTFYIRYDDPTVHSFIFDWRLEEPFCLSVGEGNYAVDVAPNQIDYKIEFTAPTDGFFLLQVHSQWLTFAQMGDIHDEPVRLESMEVLTPEMKAGEVYTVWLQTVYNYPASTNVYDTLTVTNVGEKLNAGFVYENILDSYLDLSVDRDTATFTATKDCYYRFTVTNCVFYELVIDGNEDQAIRVFLEDAEYYELYLNKGQTCEIKCVGDKVARVKVAPVDYNIIGGIVTPGAAGSRYCFQAAENSYYRVEVSGGELGIIASNGTVSWITDAYEVNMAADNTYSFMLRGAADVAVKIFPVDYSVELTNGDNTVYMEPNKYYTVDFMYNDVDKNGNPVVVDMDSNSFVALTWEGNLTVTVNGEAYAQGATIELLNADVKILVKSNGGTNVKITVTLIYDANNQEIQGESTVYLEPNQTAILAVNRDGVGATAFFTPEIGGTYTLTAYDEKVIIYVVAADGGKTQVLTGGGSYSFSVNAGETVEFFVQTSDESAVSISLVVTPGG